MKHVVRTVRAGRLVAIRKFAGNRTLGILCRQSGWRACGHLRQITYNFPHVSINRHFPPLGKRSHVASFQIPSRLAQSKDSWESQQYHGSAGNPTENPSKCEITPFFYPFIFFFFFFLHNLATFHARNYITQGVLEKGGEDYLTNYIFEMQLAK